MRPEEEGGRRALDSAGNCSATGSLCSAHCFSPLQGNMTGCRTGNGEKLSSSQAEPGQAIKSAVA